MDKNFLILKRASASRPSGEWNDDDFDVLAEKFDYRACWSFPVEAPSGKVVGTFAMYYKQPTDAQPSDLEFATALTRTAATIITRH
jgi:GAF domain-containing protein